MYVHLGYGTVIDSKDIIGIFDIEGTSVSKITRNFLAAAEKRGQVENVGMMYELPKTFTVAKGKHKMKKVYITQLSGSTLKKRVEKGKIE